MRLMKNTYFRTWNMARKTEKGGKFRKVQCRTWNMARKLKIMENEKHPLDDLKNEENTKIWEKWEMHTVGPGIWRETWTSCKMRNTQFRTWKWRGKLKRVENLEMSTVEHGIWEKNENHGKGVIHTLGLEIWRGKLKKVKS